MKKILTYAILIFVVAPVLASADTSIPTEPTPLQLATRVAALDATIVAAQNHQSLACALLPSRTSASVGQKAILAWGSVGAVDQTTDIENIRPTNGAIMLLFQSTGTWTYAFKFYDAQGNNVTCSTKIVVK